MKKNLKKGLSNFVKKMPSTKILLAITTAIILGLIIYITILLLP